MIGTKFDDFIRTSEIRLKKTETVECSLNLSEDNEDKMICLTGKVYQATDEREDTTLIYGGLATFNAVFYGDELMRVEVGAKFSFKTELPEKECAVRAVNYELYGVRLKKEGGMLYAVATLDAEIICTVAEQRKYLTDIGALTKKGSFDAVIPIRFSGTVDVEDDLDVKKIKRVLYSDAVAAIKNVKCGVGEAKVEGEAIINVLMLPFSESGDILKETRIVPFAFSFDADGADEDMDAVACAAVEKLSLKVYVDDDKNKSSVSIALVLSIRGQAFGRASAEYVADCYSTENELSLTRSAIDARTGKACFFGEHIEEKLNCAVPEYTRFLKLAGERTEIASVTLSDGRCRVEGVLTGSALFADGENKISSKPFNMPFNAQFDSTADAVEDLTVAAEEINCKLKNGRLNADVDLLVSYNEYENLTCDVICDVTEGEKKSSVAAAVSVYIGVKGDDEWEVTKRLGVSQEDIASFNPQISYPLAGGERIIVYRQK